VIVIPAIDLRGGACVRLRQGRADEQTTFSDDPVAVAQRWAELGAARLHVVDLDGAFAGAPRQTALIAAIARAVSPIPVEAGGGLRAADAVDTLLGAGARWAVLGTRAALDAAFLKDVCATHPGRVIVALDARGDRVAVKGWTETSDETLLDVGRRAADAGAAALLYTDVARDGMESGPNVEMTRALVETVAIPVLASGGVGTLDHLRDLATISGLGGGIIGRALYTGAIDLSSAIEVF
jgi:phosphoribosylformimino-5-aminoimidazole carboxamide ribotide isomerase